MTITLVQAGSGSGKTYEITKQLVQRLANGSVRPEHVLATTFTNAAAAELKDRVRQRILHPEEGDAEIPRARRLNLASTIEEAFIGTVHSIGHQIVSRYAIQLGRSPVVEVVEEKAQERHLRRIFAEMPPDGLRELDLIARRLCITDVQKDILELLAAKRSNGIDDGDFRQGLVDGIERLIEAISGGVSQNLEAFDTFYSTCKDALDRIAGNEDETKTTADSRRQLEDFIQQRPQEWRVWSKVASLKWAQKSKADVAFLTEMARRANVHERLHADLRELGAHMVNQVLELQQRYRTYKDEMGLADFTDLEERFLELLRVEWVREDLDLDLVVVDEFQDTNPIQLAIFQELASLAKESLWVGDKKQAIYGFRGTDPELIEAVMERVQHSRPLENNWRSNEGLVRFVNRVFTPIFGDDAALNPVHQGDSHVERWILEGRNRDIRQEAFVAAMQHLCEYEKPGEVAVLVRKNDDAKDLAALLMRAGVPALAETSGLLSTREGAAMMAGLRLVADPKDRLASAIVRHVEDIEPTPVWFKETLAEPDALLRSPVLEAIRAVNARTLPPVGAIEAVIQAMELPDRIAEWGDPRRRAANLDALVLLGKQYEERVEQEGKAATITGLIYWLADLRSKGEDMVPVPKGVDAVTITTTWKAKGLEWPCVVLYEEGQAPPPDPFSIQVEGGDAANGRPLEGRKVRYWPYPFGYTHFGTKNSDGCGVKDGAEQSMECQAMIAAREEETKRLLYVGFTRAKRKLILAEGRRNPLELLGNIVPKGEGTDDDGFTYATVACANEPKPVAADGETVEWFDLVRGPAEYPARYWSPSRAEAVPCSTDLEKIGEPVPRVKSEDWSDLGEAVHTYLAALPALRSLDNDTLLRHAEACLTRWGQRGVVEAEHLVRAGRNLEEWVEREMPRATWYVEATVTAPRAQGGQWAGTIDLLLEAEDGYAVMDHKSSDFGESGWTQKAEAHSGQLLTYVELLGVHEKVVKLALIHLPLAGGVVEVIAK